MLRNGPIHLTSDIYMKISDFFNVQVRKMVEKLNKIKWQNLNDLITYIGQKTMQNRPNVTFTK